jgi:hydrogenase/urease accessory protein HupE
MIRCRARRTTLKPRQTLRPAVTIILLLIVPGVVASSACADDSRPLFIEINELDAGRYKIGVRMPPSVSPMNQPSLALPTGCAEISTPGQEREPQTRFNIGLDYTHYRCDQGLAGRMIEIRYPYSHPAIPTVTRFNFSDGRTHTVVLAAGETRVEIPRSETRWSVARDYFRLGVHHIWAGTDHLLFLVCLIFISGTFSRVLTTITGFTIAHSVTLALSALDVVRLPVQPVEAAIALSVVYLAVEVVKGRRDNITWRYPIAVSCSFGLLHGLGFAAVLNEIGLPNKELATGLLFFNLGVEAGQVVFAALVMATLAVIGAAIRHDNNSSSMTVPLRKTLGYAVGVLAAFWVFERVASFVA